MNKKPTKKKVVNQFPPGWNEAKVRALIDYYDHQTEDEAVAEAEAALAKQRRTVMSVPLAIVPAVRDLIAKHQRAREARR